MAQYIEFTDHSHWHKDCPKRGKLYYVGEPDQALIDELGLTKVSKHRDGSGIEYESTLPEITAKAWDLVFVVPSETYKKKCTDSREITITVNSYIFRKTL